MRRTEQSLFEEHEHPNVSLALVYGSVIGGLNVVSAVVSLMMAG
jgi:hypothetical protein